MLTAKKQKKNTGSECKKSNDQKVRSQKANRNASAERIKNVLRIMEFDLKHFLQFATNHNNKNNNDSRWERWCHCVSLYMHACSVCVFYVSLLSFHFRFYFYFHSMVRLLCNHYLSNCKLFSFSFWFGSLPIFHRHIIENTNNATMKCQIDALYIHYRFFFLQWMRTFASLVYQLIFVHVFDFYCFAFNGTD